VDSIVSDVDPPVGANRVEPRLLELLDSLKETLHANIAAIQMVTAPQRAGPDRGPATGHDYDWRQLSETGIEPGMRLEAIRPERRHGQQP
jgi:hypothetical protein